MGQTQPDMLTTERSKREKEGGGRERVRDEARKDRKLESLEDTFRGSAEKGRRAVRWRQDNNTKRIKSWWFETEGIEARGRRSVGRGCDCDRARWRRWATRDRARALAHSKETGEKE